MKKLLLLCLPSLLSAQFYFSRPDCHTWRGKYDSFVSYGDKGAFIQPAAIWDAETALLSVGTSIALRKAKVPKPIAVAIPVIGYGLLLHIEGHRRGYYNIDLAHWTQVLADRSAPYFWGYRKRGALEWSLAYASTMCWDR